MQSTRFRTRGWIFGLLLALAVPLPAAAQEYSPRELSDAEQQAVLLAVDYLSSGAEAWWQRLSAESPLRRLGREAALEVIEVRAGPPAAARWRLQTVPAGSAADTAAFTIELPSGMDETLFLRLRQEGGSWTLHDLRMSAEAGRGFRPAREASSEASGETAGGKAARQSMTIVGGLGVLAAALLIFAIGRAGVVRVLLGLAGVAAAAAAVFLYLRPPESPTPASEAAAAVPTEAGPEGELAGLLELRRSLALPDAEAVEAALAAVPEGGEASRVARLWQAEQALDALDLNAVDAILQSLPSPAETLQAERLRARLAFLRMDEVDTALGYERALAAGVTQDALLYEAAQALELLGFSERAAGYYRQLGELGSREADLYYQLAGTDLIAGRQTRALFNFRKGWRLEPRPREEVLGHPLQAWLVQEIAELREMMRLSSVSDPRVGCEAVSSETLTLPQGAQARVLGGFLAVDFEAGGVEVPGGCGMAPADAVVYDAATWRDQRENEVLAALPVLMANVGSTGDLSRPRIRQHVEEAVTALGRRGRWTDVLQVTKTIGTKIIRIPTAVVQLRAEALRRAGRSKDAIQLLIALVARNSKNRRVDPGTLFQLAELLVSEGDYDRGLRLMAKAHSELPFEVPRGRLLQVQVEKRLAESSAVYESGHFEIFYPYSRAFYFAERVAEILEAERQRLKKWIPVGSRGSTQVYLLDFGDWRESYGTQVIGLYDGKIRLPFAEVAYFSPLVVSILTHELAHAMIAEATKDRAPHWLQEGLAQHVEMPQGMNPISDYDQVSSLLAFPLVEPVLKGFAAPSFVLIAYDEARWIAHYLESQHGVRSIHRLLAAFRDGNTTEQAVRKVLKRSIPELDRQIWAWCLDEAPNVWPSEIIEYDEAPREPLYEEEPEDEPEGDYDD